MLLMSDGGDDDRSSSHPRRRLISAGDVALLAYLALLVLPAWALPERWLPLFGRALAWSSTRLRPRRARRNSLALGSLFGDRLRSPASSVHRAVVANVHVHNMLYLRAARPGGWKPRIRLEGGERIRRAIDDRCGAIIWNAPLVFDSLLTKMTLAGADLRAHHLSHLHHFMSNTRFGVRVHNRLLAAVEGRYLAGRLVMGPDGDTEALRELRRRIESNEVVSITAGGLGRRTYTASFLDGVLHLPTGAPQLARRTGAHLLPAFTVREPDGSFVTRIEPRLPVSTVAERSDALRAAVAAFAERLESYVTKCPEQCSPSVYRAEQKA